MHTSRVASAAALPLSTFLCLALVAMSVAAGSTPPASGSKGAGAARQSPPANAVTDFGPSQNPAGAWSYGQRAAKELNSTFTAYQTNANVFGVGLESWSTAGNCCPSVTRNATGGTVVYSNAPSVAHPADVLNLHPGASGQRSAVRWTAPSAGTVTIQGRFEGIDQGTQTQTGTTTDFAILGNATAAQPPTLYRGTVQGYQNVTRFSVARVVAAGEVIEFSVGFGLQASPNDPPPTANNDSTGLAVTITYGTPSPETTGQWGPLLEWNTSQMAQAPYPSGTGFQKPVAIHSNLLPNGNVLFWARDTTSETGGDLLDSTPGARVWQPAALAGEPGIIDPANRGTFTITGLPTTNLFCAGHAFLPDGRLLTAGGHHGADGYGEVHTNLFDWRNNTWTRGPDMGLLNQMGRWYPTVITLANGDAAILSGTYRDISGPSPVTRDNHIPQVWHSTGATGTLRNLTAKPIPALPRMHLAPDGRVYVSGPQRGTYFLDTSGAGTWTDAPNSPGTTDRWNGSSVMYDVGKVLIMGGGQDNADPQKRPLDSAATIDLNVSPLAWQPAASMSYRREFINATILADGQVLVTGGSAGRDNDEQQAAMAPELWNPDTGQWTTMATMLSYRGYHTTALLLPDGKVLVAGSGQPPSPPPGTNAQIFSPPYLFRGPRPVIKSAPASVNYNQTFFVETDDTAAVSKVTLVRLGSVTHAFDANQRFNRLTFTAGVGGLNVTAPATANACPPGHYMLFILNGDGVPSVSKIVKIDPATPAPPGAPAALVSAANASLAVDITWAASSGNVDHYEVHRGPTRAGPFTRIAANVVGLAFTDSTAPGGTAHVYRVRAVDPLGNFSAFGNSDFATTVLFTDDPLAAGVVVKAEHLAQLRQAVNAVRAAAGLAQVGWTDAAVPGTNVRAVHVQELRSAIEPALAQFGLAFGQYTDPTLTPNVTPIRAAHWQELRDRVK